MKRRTELQQLVFERIEAVLLPGVALYQDRENPFEEEHLPAVNLARLDDDILEVVRVGSAAALRRCLQLSIDLYGEGAGRFEPLDDQEQALCAALLTLGDAGVGGFESLTLGGAKFDQETPLAVICSTRIPLAIEYIVNL